MGMGLPIEEITNENFEEELRHKRLQDSGEQEPYQQVPAQQIEDYPIYFFTIQKPYGSPEGTTYFSSDKQQVFAEFEKNWQRYNSQYKGNYESNPYNSRNPTSWTFYLSRDLVPIPAIIIIAIYEATKRSPVFISNVETMAGYGHYTQKQRVYLY